MSSTPSGTQDWYHSTQTSKPVGCFLVPWCTGCSLQLNCMQNTRSCLWTCLWQVGMLENYVTYLNKCIKVYQKSLLREWKEWINRKTTGKKIITKHISNIALGKHKGFPGGTVVKNPPANSGDTRDMGLIPGLGRSPRKEEGQPTPVFLCGKFHPQRSLAGVTKSWTWLSRYTHKRS